MATQPAKLYGLDHLRTFAITFVLLFHYRFFGSPDWVRLIAKFGWTGVDLFFVLSGYLISSHLFAEHTKTGSISLRTFFIKRSFRILPAYWFIVAVYFLIPAYREWGTPSPLWRYLTFTENFGLDLRVHSTFSHSWSLCVEEQFYLVLPLVLLALYTLNKAGKGIYILLFFFLAGFLIRLYGWHLLAPYQNTDGFAVQWHKLIYYPVYNRLDGLLVGIAVAALFQYRPHIASRLIAHGNWFILIGLMILAAAYWICLQEDSFVATIFGFPLVAIGYGTIVIAAISPQSLLYRTKSRVTEKIAALSYGIYLSHKGVIHLTQQFLTSRGLTANSNLMMLLCFIAIVTAALLLNVVIEKPFLRLRNRVLASSK